MISMTLHTLGWSGFFESQLTATPAGIPGRVASANHGRFLIWTETGNDETETGEVDASVTGSLRKSGALWPAVGDWVILRPDAPVIDRVLNRQTCLSRKQPEREIREQVLAANIDVLFIVSGLDRDYNPRRIERFLVMANESGARPVVLLNKADLIGSSGVGKSTILNRLLGDERQRTTAVRPSDSRGRHTTTTRQLFRMPGGWLLMDLPGLREVQLWANPDQAARGSEASLDANLAASFDDIQALAANCRFRDCTHTAEPGCAVTAAALDPARLANYQKMQKELAQLERKTNPRLGKEARAKGNVIEKSVRHHPKRSS
jgi:ribosome biogenesis GTPase / thiamine phosphate phosphatase